MPIKYPITALLFVFAAFSSVRLAHSQGKPAAGVKPPGNTSHEAEVMAWRLARINGLKRPQSWLSLIALNWLKEGENVVAGFGTVTLRGSVVRFTALPGVQAKMGDAAFASGILRSDGEKDGPDKIEAGARAFVVIQRGERYAVRMWDGNAETLRNFTGIESFPISLKWRIEARWKPYSRPKRIKVASVVPGYSSDYDVPGAAHFSLGGRQYSLEPVIEPGERSLFFIFADQTNGNETYGAGRFLYSDPPVRGKVLVDFNKAYNPPCAFTPYATCPLPPASNRLKVRVEAGEMRYRNH